jgi:hypothetical protein
MCKYFRFLQNCFKIENILQKLRHDYMGAEFHGNLAAATIFVGVTFPFFGALLGFFGGFAFAPTTYFLPCIMWLCIYKPKPFSLSWLTNWICIILGVLLMFTASIGGLQQIIVDAKTYKFYA